MSTVPRFISLILIVMALILLGADLVTSLEKGGQVTVRSIGQVWLLLEKPGAQAFNSWLVQTLPPPVPGWVDAVMALPAWALTGVLGAVLAFLFGRQAAERV
jgi:hypothetical protein